MTFGIFISTIVFTYLIGVFAAQKAFDRSADPDMPEAERTVARARAAIFWPARLVGKVARAVSDHASVPQYRSFDVHTDQNL